MGLESALKEKDETIEAQTKIIQELYEEELEEDEDGKIVFLFLSSPQNWKKTNLICSCFAFLEDDSVDSMKDDSKQSPVQQSGAANQQIMVQLRHILGKLTLACCGTHVFFF